MEFSFLPLIIGIVAITFAIYQTRSYFPTPADTVPEFVHCAPRIARIPIPSQSLIDPRTIHPPPPLNFMAQQVDGQLTPLLFRGDTRSLFRWSTDRWSAKYFIRASNEGFLPTEFAIKRSSSPVVKFANLRADRPFVREKGDKHSRWPQLDPFILPFTAHNVSVGEFFREIELSDPSSSPYFADGISVLNGLAPDVMPLEPLCPFTSIQPCDMSLWIGKGGVVAYPHYDSSHNLFVQMKGRKKFTLAAPAGARCGLGLYPSLHPFYRQVQRDIMDEDADLDPLKLFIPSTTIPEGETCCSLTLYEAVLEEGDMLYMPAGWFHRVESLSTPSFSINSWWAGKAFAPLATVLQQPLPFQEAWTTHMTMFAARVYICLLYTSMEAKLRSLDPSAPKGEFLAHELLVTRFHPLFTHTLTTDRCHELLSIPSTTPEESALHSCIDLPIEDVRRMLPADIRALHAKNSNRQLIMRALTAHFQSYVDRVMTLYQLADGELARLHVQNYAEEVLFYAINGRVDLLYPYIACCILRRD